MSPPVHCVVCAGLRFAWPDGTVVLERLDLALPAGRSGIVGRNGTGKSTLLRLIAGELTPSAGTLTVSAPVSYLPQQLPLATAHTMADLLGITAARRALRAIVAGDSDPAHFSAVGDDWDVEARAAATLDRLGLPVDLDRPIGRLSGGEGMLAAVAGLLVRRTGITLLDEPTNNLDRDARERLYAAVDTWPGVLLVVSHDRELLEHVDSIVELRDGATRVFGGTFSAFTAAVAVEQEAAARDVRAAEASVTREQRQLVEAHTKIARRQRFGARAQAEKRVPKIIAHSRKRTAQESAGRYRGVAERRAADARDSLTAAEALVRADDIIRVDLPETRVPAGKDVVRIGDLYLRGPERIALVGGNGSGKTTLLEALAGRRAHPLRGVDTPSVPTGYLPQRLLDLNDARSVFDNVRLAAPAATPHTIRAGLARFRIRGPAVDQLAATLSGGERFRVSLACLLLAQPAPQLLLLDEPTNNLDLDSVAQLTAALAGYRGALIVASHDRPFLAELGATRTWTVANVGLPVDAG